MVYFIIGVHYYFFCRVCSYKIINSTLGNYGELFKKLVLESLINLTRGDIYGKKGTLIITDVHSCPLSQVYYYMLGFIPRMTV